MSRASTGQRLPGEGWTDTQVIEYLPTCFDRDTILEILLGFSARWFDRRLVGIVGRRAIQTFSQAGWESLERMSDEELKRTRAVLEHGAAVSQGPARGRADEVGLGDLFEALGLDASTPIASVPIPISGRPAIILIGEPVVPDVTELEVVGHAMGEQLETVIKMTKSGTLPPAADRIPPFPQPEFEPHDSDEEQNGLGDQTSVGAVPRMPGSFKERPQRRTLQSGEFDAPFVDDPSKPRLNRPPLAAHTQQLDLSESEGDEDNAPRLGVAASESEPSKSDSSSNASATMFGLPADPFGKKSESDADEAPENNASSTMFGVPGTEEMFVKRREDQSGVSVLPDRDLGDDNSEGKRTLMGGIEASREMVSGRSEEEEELLYDPSVFKSDSELEADQRLELDDPPSNPNKMTLRGGFDVADMASAYRKRSEGEPGDEDEPALDDEREHTPLGTPLTPESDAIELAQIVPEEESEPDEDADSEPDEKPKSTIPQAMILRPARKIRSTPQARREDGDAAEDNRPKPADEHLDEEDDSPPDYAAATDGESISEVSNPPSSIEESSSSQTIEGVGSSDRPTRDATPADDDRLASAFDQFATAGRQDMHESSSHTAVGGGWAPAEPSEESVDDEPVDDAWLDYFAPEEDVAPEMLAPQSDPRRAQLGPATIPPEAIERIMDSGPHIVELQENFMMMDSRDKALAFQAADDVAALHEEAIPVLEMMFPGRLFVDRYQYTAETLPPVAEHGPVLAALVRIGDSALYIARKYLDHGVIESRFYAVYLLTALSAGDLIGDLFERLFDRDVQTRTIARRVLSQYRRADHFDAEVLNPLRRELRTGNDDSRIEIAADLLAEYRDVHAVEPLLAILGSYQGRANQALHKALQRITLKSWSSPYEWRQWWASAKDQKRETWMVEALNSPSDVIRTAVYEEIQRLPGLDLNYHPDQPAKLRERAQGELIEWFAGQVGKS